MSSLQHKRIAPRTPDPLAEPGRTTQTTNKRPTIQFLNAAFEAPDQPESWTHPLRRSYPFTYRDLQMI